MRTNYDVTLKNENNFRIQYIPKYIKVHLSKSKKNYYFLLFIFKIYDWKKTVKMVKIKNHFQIKRHVIHKSLLPEAKKH